MPSEFGDHQPLLPTLPPTPRQRRIALAIVLILSIAFVVTAPFRAIQLPQSAAFIAAFQAVLFVNDLITATLLFAHVSILRWRSLLVLAGGYLFTGLLAIPHALTFPGLFSPTGLLGADDQTAAWLYLIWHAGLPLAVIAYALLKEHDRVAKPSPASQRAAVGWCVMAVTLAVCGATWVAVMGGRVLPSLFVDAVHISLFGKEISAAVGLLSAVALALLWARRRSVLDLWLMVVISAWLLEIAFFVLLTALRFSLAFYASRIYALVTASVVLLVFISEITTLYVRLGRSGVAQRHEREGRVMTMNAMSASIAHEISQPIGAMMASADAALVWLAKTPPDIGNVRASVERIATDGRRAIDVIASVRSLFRREGAGAELIDVNDLVREILTIEHDALRRHAIVVRTELARGATVSFDRVQLQQVVLNLVTNAIEAMSSVTDRPRVLRMKTVLHPSGDVLIVVEDSGIGIGRDSLERIFEPYFTTKSRGMGLGLWLCRRIVEKHQGRLTASSDVGRGSRFQIALPSGKSATKSLVDGRAT
jgi:signal transduction histidine kinase